MCRVLLTNIPRPIIEESNKFTTSTHVPNSF